jgi:hypothetical protein
MRGHHVPTYPGRTERANGHCIRAHPGFTRHTTGVDLAGTITPTQWLTSLGRRWRGGHMPHLGRHLAEIADPGTGVIDLNPATLRRLLDQGRLLPPGLQRLLDILVAHGFLTPTDATPGQKPGSYRLTLRGDDRG